MSVVKITVAYVPLLKNLKHRHVGDRGAIRWYDEILHESLIVLQLGIICFHSLLTLSCIGGFWEKIYRLLNSTILGITPLESLELTPKKRLFTHKTWEQFQMLSDKQDINLNY